MKFSGNSLKVSAAQLDLVVVLCVLVPGRRPQRRGVI